LKNFSEIPGMSFTLYTSDNTWDFIADEKR
jgi:hypothetical protein